MQGVKQKMCNELELCDMSGNYSSSAQTNPYNSTAGSSRVLRGGSWFDDATYTRVAIRNNSSPTYTYRSLGFRIARTVP